MRAIGYDCIKTWSQQPSVVNLNFIQTKEKKERSERKRRRGRKEEEKEEEEEKEVEEKKKEEERRRKKKKKTNHVTFLLPLNTFFFQWKPSSQVKTPSIGSLCCGLFQLYCGSKL